MKKLIIFAVMLSSMAFIVPQVEAKGAPTNAVVQEMLGQPGRWDRNRHRRSVVRTRIIRRGFARYRETYRITYLPNGRTIVRVIDRDRIG